MAVRFGLKAQLVKGQLSHSQCQNPVCRILEPANSYALLEAHLPRAQEMEALGALSSGIAHDFNNILTVDAKEEISLGHCMVFADLSQMHQVLMNLCINAAQVMGMEEGTLRIEIAKVNLSSEQCESIGEIIPGKYVEIAISDTGDGITPGNKPLRRLARHRIGLTL